MRSETYEKGLKLISEEDTTDKIILILSGVIDIETTVDEQSFVIERLMKGAVLNYRNFLYKDKFKVIAKCKSITQVLYLDDATFEDIRSKNDDIEAAFQDFISLEDNSEENIDKLILDYILPIAEDDHRSEKIIHRRNNLTRIFKNSAIRQLLDNKRSRPPKLKDILKMAIEKMRSKEANKKNNQKDQEEEDESSEDEGDEEAYQTDYLREVADDINIAVSYTSKTINEFEQKLIDFQKERKNKKDKV
jgi:CRP-like cAMP-binding protein